MNGQFGKDLTQGSVAINLIKFALPILLANMVSTAYSIVDMIWVGNLLGKDAVGAIAVTFPIFLGMIALSSGVTLATSILISKAYGAKDLERIQRIVNNSWSVAMIVILIFIVGGLMLSDSLLHMLGTSQQMMPLAKGYLQIIILNFAALYLNYLISGILRGIGDTVTPLKYVLISTAINAFLAPVLILGLGPLPKLSLNGAAWATFLSTGITTVLGMNYILHQYRNQPILPSKICLEKEILQNIVGIGLPSFLQQMLISIGYGVTTIFVNHFGDAAIAAFGVANKMDSIVAMPAIAMMMAASALTAQCIGAGKSEQIREIFKWGILLNIPIILFISMACVFFPDIIMSIFVKESEVIGEGITYLRIVGVSYLTYILFYISNGIINGAGKAISTMIISFISLCIIRIPIAAYLSNTDLGIRGVWYAIVISSVITTINSLGYYFSGRWRSGR